MREILSNRVADKAIATLVSTFFLLCLAYSPFRAMPHDMVFLGSFAVITGSVAVMWFALFRRQAALFSATGIAASAVYLACHLILVLRKSPEYWYMALFSDKVLIAALLIGLLASRLFLRNWDDNKSPRYLQVGIGVTLIVRILPSLLSTVYAGKLFPAIIFSALASIAIGVGCIKRNPSLGIVVYWAFAAIGICASALHLVSAPLAVVCSALVTILFGVVLNIFLKDEFKWDGLREFWENANRPSSPSSSTFSFSKSCSACGRTVPLSSGVGQRCPYCGAYWSRETSIH